MTRVTRLATLSTMAAVGVVALPLVTGVANADNARLNRTIAVNVYTIKYQAGCKTDILANPKLRLAAQWHSEDLLNNRALDGDIGSDGSTVADRARNAGYAGPVAETVMINPALAVSAIEVMNNWYYRPDYMAIMSDCGNTDIGVWSVNALDRTVLVAVYGKGDGAPPVQAPQREFGGVPGWTP